MKDFKKYFPEHLGVVIEASRINVGLSGSAIYSVVTDKGSLVMRVHRSTNGDWRQLLIVQALASLHKITPEVHYVDEKDLVVVSTKIIGPHFGAAIRDPKSAPQVFPSLIENLQKLHSLSTDDLNFINPVEVIKEIWEKQSLRAGFPIWCSQIKNRIDELGMILKTDERRVVSHNDLNPSNILWDDSRVWFIDWEIAGLNHPYYDLATISTFLNLPDEMSIQLLSAQEKAEINSAQKIIFKTYLELTAIIYGTLILSLVPDLEIYPHKTLESTLTLPEVYEKMAKGEIDLQTPYGQAFMSMAMLKAAVTRNSQLV